MTGTGQHLTIRTPASRKSRSERWPELVEVAAYIFAEKGYEAASLQDIAERVGMLKGSLYHHITSKSDLLVHVLREAHRRGLHKFVAIGEGGGTAISRLEAMVSAHARFICTERTFTATFIQAHRFLPETRQIEFIDAERNYRLLTENLIAQGQKDGALRADLNPKLAALCLMGFLNALHLWVRPGGAFSIRRICEHAVAQGLDGLRV